MSDKTLELCLEGRRIKRIKAFTIAADAMTEITYRNTDVFRPRQSETEGNVFVLPAAGVSALEIEFE